MRSGRSLDVGHRLRSLCLCKQKVSGNCHDSRMAVPCGNSQVSDRIAVLHVRMSSTQSIAWRAALLPSSEFALSVTPHLRVAGMPSAAVPNVKTFQGPASLEGLETDGRRARVLAGPRVRVADENGQIVVQSRNGHWLRCLATRNRTVPCVSVVHHS